MPVMRAIVLTFIPAVAQDVQELRGGFGGAGGPPEGGAVLHGGGVGGRPLRVRGRILPAGQSARRHDHLHPGSLRYAAACTCICLGSTSGPSFCC